MGLKDKAGYSDKKVWQQLERSAPMMLRDGNVWFVRVLYNLVEKQFYFDVRRFLQVEDENGLTDYVADNTNGTTLLLSDWNKLFDPFVKMSNKWRKQIKENNL